MSTISEIYSQINSEYTRLQNEHRQSIDNSRQYMYERFPRIQEIDSEISMLAINSARRVIEENLSPEEATCAMKQKADALNKERESILTENNYVQYTPDYVCKVCSDTGYVDGGKKCR